MSCVLIIYVSVVSAFYRRHISAEFWFWRSTDGRVNKNAAKRSCGFPHQQQERIRYFQSKGLLLKEKEFLSSVSKACLLGIHSIYFLSETSGKCYTSGFYFFYFYFSIFIFKTIVPLLHSPFKNILKLEKNKKWVLCRSVMVIVVGKGHGDKSSNLGRDWLHFT